MKKYIKYNSFYKNDGRLACRPEWNNFRNSMGTAAEVFRALKDDYNAFYCGDGIVKFENEEGITAFLLRWS